jgi:hypothetical protein
MSIKELASIATSIPDDWNTNNDSKVAVLGRFGEIIAALREALPALRELVEETRWRYCEQEPPWECDDLVYVEFCSHDRRNIQLGTYSKEHKSFHDGIMFIDSRKVYAYRRAPDLAPKPAPQGEKQ